MRPTRVRANPSLIARICCTNRADARRSAARDFSQASAMQADSSDEEGAHAVSTLSSLFVAAWPDTEPLMSLGQLLHVIGSIKLRGKPLALESHELIGMVLDELRLAGDKAQASKIGGGQKARSGKRRRHEQIYAWLPSELAEAAATCSPAEVREWAAGVVKASVGHLLTTTASTPSELIVRELLQPNGGLASYLLSTLAEQRMQLAIARAFVTRHSAFNLRTERAHMSHAIARVLSPCLIGEALPSDAAHVLWEACHDAAPTLAQLWRQLATIEREWRSSEEDSADRKFAASLFAFDALTHVAVSRGRGTSAVDHPLGTLLAFAQMSSGASRNHLRLPAALGQHIYPDNLDKVIDERVDRDEALLHDALLPGAH